MPKSMRRLCVALALLLCLASCAPSAQTGGTLEPVPGAVSSGEVPPANEAPRPSETVPSSSPPPAVAASPSQPTRTQEPSQSAAPSAVVNPSQLPAQTPPPAASPSAEPSPDEAAGKVVTVKIEGPDGWLIEGAEVEFAEDMTAADAIALACEAEGVELETRGKGKTVYIVSIGGYGEKSAGALSGWIFKLNGVHSSVGAGSAVLSEGDRVSVYFSLDMGMDAKDKD